MFLSLMAGLTISRVGTTGRRGWFPWLTFSLSVFFSVPQGDVGGALLCARVAEGIVSYRQPNAKFPAVFTQISHYRPWVDKVLKEN